VDGTCTGSLDLSTSVLYENSEALYVGAINYSTKYGFPGHIDELRIIKGAAAWGGWIKGDQSGADLQDACQDISLV
jgi:hypothetical protein